MSEQSCDSRTGPQRHTGRDSGRSAGAGGKIAGNARKQLEKRLGRSIVSKKRYIEKTENDLTLPEIGK